MSDRTGFFFALICTDGWTTATCRSPISIPGDPMAVPSRDSLLHHAEDVFR